MTDLVLAIAQIPLHRWYAWRSSFDDLCGYFDGDMNASLSFFAQWHRYEPSYNAEGTGWQAG